ncbi:MAG: alanine racemase, partial [Alphaproteobacteria bacterium]|nr:alanine racemase [Alphaproteobacteria bacterium]
RALLQQGCKTFFVAHLDEGITLRRTAPDADIYILNGLTPGDEGVFQTYSLRPVLNDLGQLECWGDFCSAQAVANPSAALQLDTGMSRLGLSISEQKTLFSKQDRLDPIQVTLVMSHLACADEPDNPMNRAQLREFQAALQNLPSASASLAASSGIFLGPEWRFDMVRPGLCLYGVKPNDLAPNPMAAVVRLQGKILQIQNVDASRSVGYGATHRVGKPTRVATIAAGYADGFSRMLSNQGFVTFNNHPLPILGRVSMDLITVDFSALPDDASSPRPGDLVDLIGPNRTIDDLATDAGTIGYEILTSLGNRYRRRYIGAASLSTPAEAV